MWWILVKYMNFDTKKVRLAIFCRIILGSGIGLLFADMYFVWSIVLLLTSNMFWNLS